MRVPIRRMRDEGLLFEINRRVLHPIGYALALTLPEPGAVDEVADAYLYETDDPEGYFMDQVSDDERAALRGLVCREARYLGARERLGFERGVQPVTELRQ